MRQTLTQGRLKALLHYDEGTGQFTWRVSKGAAKAGRVAGSLLTKGYRHISVDGTLYRAHRLAWLFVHARWPPAGLDHRNGDRADNRIGNLREATQAENQQNRRAQRGKKSGLPTGVTPFGSKYQAQIKHAGKQLYLGLFPTPEEAHAAYLAAKAELHTFQPVPRGAA